MKMQRLACLLFAILSSSYAFSGIEAGVSFDANAETTVEDSHVDSSISITPYISANYLTQRSQSEANASLQIGSENDFQIENVDWQAGLNTQVDIISPAIAATATYNHSVTNDVLGDAESISDDYSVGLLSQFQTSRQTSHNLSVQYQWQEVESARSTNKQLSDTVLLSYTAARLFKGGSKADLNMSFIDYLNNTTSTSANLNYSRPRDNAQWRASAGVVNTVSEGQDSLVLTWLLDYSVAFRDGVTAGASFTKDRTDVLTVIMLDNVGLELTNQEVVDQTAFTVDLGFSLLESRLNTEISYRVQYIETAFSLNESNTTFYGYSDEGQISTSYALSPRSSFSLNTQFSLREETATLFGNLEYQRELQRGLMWRIGASSSDFSKGADRFYTSLSYDLELISKND